MIVKLLIELSTVIDDDCNINKLVSVPLNDCTFGRIICLVLNGPSGVKLPVYIAVPLTIRKLLIRVSISCPCDAPVVNTSLAWVYWLPITN